MAIRDLWSLSVGLEPKMSALTPKEPIIAMSDAQLKVVMTAATGIPIEKRDTFTARRRRAGGAVTLISCVRRAKKRGLRGRYSGSREAYNKRRVVGPFTWRHGLARLCFGRASFSRRFGFIELSMQKNRRTM